MIINIHSKHEYFDQQLSIETKEFNQLKDEFMEFIHCYKNSASRYDRTCSVSRVWISDSHINYIIDDVFENNRYIKRSYDDILSPLQYSLVFICLFNIFCMIIIYKNPTTYFCISILFAIICVWIQGEFQIEDKPNVYYTLVISVGILFFSVFLLIKILFILSNIMFYHRMKTILNKPL